MDEVTYVEETSALGFKHKLEDHVREGWTVQQFTIAATAGGSIVRAAVLVKLKQIEITHGAGYVRD